MTIVGADASESVSSQDLQVVPPQEPVLSSILQAMQIPRFALRTSM
jgi:hypothetical protein